MEGNLQEYYNKYSRDFKIAFLKSRYIARQACGVSQIIGQDYRAVKKSTT